MVKRNVLLVEDNAMCRGNIRRAIQDQVQVFEAETKADALKALKRSAMDVILLDISLPDNTSLDIVKTIVQASPASPVIVITEDDSPETAAEVIKLGGVDYVRKSKFFEDTTILKNKLSSIFESQRFKAISEAQEDQLNHLNRHWFVPDNDLYHNAYHRAEIALKGNLNLLIYGETGVGKNQLVSRIHQQVCPQMPMVTVDCGAIPKELVESELFGHERGAFTGAEQTKKGKIELANGGVLFLDEVSNASLDIQVKLLRVLQEKKICRVGSTAEIDVDFTLITATNRDLKQDVEDGRFKDDLYYRIKQVEVELPALRNIPKLIPTYVYHFIKIYSAKYRTSFPVTDDFVSLLSQQAWRGNLRELDSEIQKIVFTHSIGEDYRQFMNPIQAGYTIKVKNRQQEQEEILEALKRNNYRITHAAEDLGIKRTTLHSRMKRLGIEV